MSDASDALNTLTGTAATFHGLLEAVPDAMVIADREGCVVLVNAQAERLFGYPRDELVGKHVEQLMPERYHNGHATHHSAFQRDPRVRAMGTGLELVARRKDGSEFPVEITLSPLEITGGVLMSSAIRDITERKRTESDLRRAQDGAEIATRELEAFSYAVAHDLRAPLRAINGYSVALVEDLSDKLDGEARDYLQRITAGAERMGQLIDALLGLARITRAAVSGDLVDLTRLAHEVIARLRANEPGRIVECSVACELLVRGDRQLLRVLLENLLGNAWKFTQNREPANIELGVSDDPEGHAYFVRDNGVGFDMAYAHKLFVAFQRLHQPSELDGTGIGLATAQRIVQRHGGRIWAHGAADRGATFHFTLESPRERKEYLHADCKTDTSRRG